MDNNLTELLRFVPSLTSLIFKLVAYDPKFASVLTSQPALLPSLESLTFVLYDSTHLLNNDTLENLLNPRANRASSEPGACLTTFRLSVYTRSPSEEILLPDYSHRLFHELHGKGMEISIDFRLQTHGPPPVSWQ